MSADDLAAVSFHLRTALAVFERQRKLTPGEISAKSVLAILLREVEAKAGLAEATIEQRAG